MTDPVESLATLAELLEKATPIEHATLIRYEHGGGRYYVAKPREYAAYRDTEDRTLIADFYHEGDRELFVTLRNAAPALLDQAKRLEEIAKLRERIHSALVQNDNVPDTERVLSDVLALLPAPAAPPTR